MQKIIIGAALALSLTFAATASADSFDTFHPGSVNDQFGWKATGPYDQEVVNVRWRQQAPDLERRHVRQLRGHAVPAPVVRPARGRHNVLTNEFTFKTATRIDSPVLP